MEIKVEFYLFASDFPVEKVYNLVGLKGKCQRLEEAKFVKMSNDCYIRQAESSITYSTGYVNTIEVCKLLEQMYAMLHPCEEMIIKCVDEYQLQSKFCIVMNITENPIIELSHEFVAMAFRLKADIEIDSYIDLERKEI